MTELSLSQNNPAGGGFKITPSLGRKEVTISELSLKRRYQEYLSSDYCIACFYFKEKKGHFGFCLDNPLRVFDGTKKGNACVCWRVKPIYRGIPQKLPEIPRIKIVKQIRVRRNLDRYFKSRFSFTVDNFILVLARDGYSTRKIAREVLNRFGVKLDHTSVMRKIHLHAPEVKPHKKCMCRTDPNYLQWIQKHREASLAYFGARKQVEIDRLEGKDRIKKESQ